MTVEPDLRVGVASGHGGTVVSRLDVGATSRLERGSLPAVTRDGTVRGDDATDDGPAINAAIVAGAEYIPPGVYRTSVPIVAAKLVVDAGATIKATAPMSAVLRTDIATKVRDGSFQGIGGRGTIDANGMASIGVHLRNFVNFPVRDLVVLNAVTAVKLGDSGADRAAEANVADVRLGRSEGLPVPAGSVGVLIENSGDHTLGRGLVINAYEKGVVTPAGGNGTNDDIHVWTDPANGVTKVGFDDASNQNIYSSCYADTPTQHGFLFSGFGQVLSQCKVALNSTGLHNVVKGIEFTQANPLAALAECQFFGAGVAHQLAVDVVAPSFNTVFIDGTQEDWVLTKNALTSRAIALIIRDLVVAGQGFAADASAPSNSLGLSIRTGGLNRWRWITDGTAEAGANAGTGLRLTRHADDGTQLGEVVFITRSSGTITVKSSIVLQDGAADIVAGSTTGSKIGTNAAQKLGFFGNAPVVKPVALTAADATAFTAADASAVDATYDAAEAAVLANLRTRSAQHETVVTNLRTRINQLESRLQLLGLLS